MSTSEAPARPDVTVRPGLYRPVPGEAPLVHLLAGECGDCGALTFPAATVCPNCQRPTSGERELATQGTVFSYTVVRARPPGYDGPVPYALGLVDLPDGLRVFSMITYSDDDAIDVGTEVQSIEVEVGTDDAPATSYAFEKGGRRG